MIEIRHAQSTSDSKVAYEGIYQGRGIRHFDSFYIFLLGLLRPLRPGKLLDVACGEGSVLRFARQKGLEAYGIDFSEAAARKSALVCPQGRVQVANGEYLPYRDESFEYVTCIGSLEHFEHPVPGAAEMARVLKREGKALILLPNTFGLWHNGHAVIRTGDVRDDGQPIQRYATRAQWTQLLEASGLRVERVTKYERCLPRTLGDLGWFLRHPRKFLVTVLVLPLIPTNLASCLVFHCRKQ